MWDPARESPVPSLGPVYLSRYGKTVFACLSSGQASQDCPEKLAAMKVEMPKYNSIVKTIKPLSQRKDAKGVDTFSLSSPSGAGLCL